MGIKSILSKPLAKYTARQVSKWSSDGIKSQQLTFQHLIQRAADTEFGKAHRFSKIKRYCEFKEAVPLRNYEAFKVYIDAIIEGKSDVLWPGKPLYLAKTSGTTSGAKYIPLTKESMPYHIRSARDVLLMYIYQTGKADFLDGKMMFLQGSPVLNHVGQMHTGRLSGLVYHHVPKYLLGNRMPGYESNCIEDWEEKVQAICRETIREKMTLISGIPPWVITYFEELLRQTGKSTVKEVFPELSLFIHPYKRYDQFSLFL